MIWTRIQWAPLAWICLVWAIGAGIAFALARRAIPRMLWINGAAILLAIGLVEGAMWWTLPRNPYIAPPGVTIEGDFARPHYFIELPSPGLGYRPRPGMSVDAVKRSNGRVVYSVHYSVGPDGLRVAPPANEQTDLCVLMFGDSFAWGEGVEDRETTAYQLGVLSGGHVKVRNFAFTGYGAHQMLWQVQNGDVQRKAGCDPGKPVLAIYQTLPNNVARVAGLRGWDVYGPRYRLDADGRPTYADGFDAGDSIRHDRLFVPRRISVPLSRIQLYSRIFGQDRKTDAFDVQRYAAIVAAARDGLGKAYPRLTFITVVWPDLEEKAWEPGSHTATLIDSLRAAGIDTRPAEAILPGFTAAPAAALIPEDGHPTAETHRRVAAYFLAQAPAAQLK